VQCADVEPLAVTFFFGILLLGCIHDAPSMFAIRAPPIPMGRALLEQWAFVPPSSDKASHRASQPSMPTHRTTSALAHGLMAPALVQVAPTHAAIGPAAHSAHGKARR
jgi:hypothetical protein